MLRSSTTLRTYRSEAYLAQDQPDGDQIVAMAGGPRRMRADERMSSTNVIDDVRLAPRDRLVDWTRGKASASHPLQTPTLNPSLISL